MLLMFGSVNCISAQQTTNQEVIKEMTYAIGMTQTQGLKEYLVNSRNVDLNFLSSFEKGAIFALGISLHNIPMGMLIYSSLADSKKAKKIAVFASVTVSTLIGGILMKLIAKHLTENVISCLVAMASGMIIYIIFLELIPHVIKTKPAKISIIGIITGFLIVLLSCKLA